MWRPHFLTKSRFKIGCECPRKLYYTDRPDEYQNEKTEDPFLKALADGGFQVGALAQAYYPTGREITERDPGAAAQETEAALRRAGNGVLFEAALQSDNLLVRVDVLDKHRKNVDLIEVKAKSFDPDEDSFFTKKTGQVASAWLPYLLDVAFQVYVARKAHPDWKITPWLMMAEKRAIATVDGLNQRFLIAPGPDGRSIVSQTPGTTRVDLGGEILVRVNVSEEVDLLLRSPVPPYDSFEEAVREFDRFVRTDAKAKPLLDTRCKHCEFRIAPADLQTGLKAGFDECWLERRDLKPSDLRQPFVFDVWNFRRASGCLEAGKCFAAGLTEEEIGVKDDSSHAGLSASERQWEQVRRIKGEDASPYRDDAGLKREMAAWTYPLHMIDFETAMVAIPFHRGRRPYEQIAFQFSHHLLNADGSVVHQDQFLHAERGVFPNFDFVRALRAALEGDAGSIFRYAQHENTVLRQIRAQLEASKEKDRKDLMAWIDTVTTARDGAGGGTAGARTMIDLREVVKRYYYHPRMGGSNSIKQVLPAVLADSKFLKKKYGRPVYGAAMPSKNFRDWTWIQLDGRGEVQDPYHLLPRVFDDHERETLDRLYSSDELADGGAAMTAYARMQFTEMSAAERARIETALFKYCELDTLAMVMLVEYFLHRG